ncbi:hypothetical protein D5018_19030 [Parashewanella curva]|uniref:Lipoprotein n=1 Tax=Parashewanella curva TaxID=2338552 RepID=A0A3L8PRW4_9GAMM|nr:hypothetical protein [Parashewanella curva]RLV58116.1 hypothetical protein D5018_19030 [Parashewanella curva]
MKKLSLAIVVCFSTLMAGCMNIPLTTMYKIMTMNPYEIDPRQMVVAVGSPEGLSVENDDIVIDFHFTAPQEPVSFKHKFFVQVNSDYPLPEELKDELYDNRKITVLQLSENDAELMYQAQQTVKSYREKHEDGAGTIFIRIQSVCFNKRFSIDDAELDLFLKIKENEEFFTFMEGLDATDLESNRDKNANKIRQCENR